MIFTSQSGLTDARRGAELADQAYEPVGSTPAAFGAFIAAETRKWGEVIKVSGATLD